MALETTYAYDFPDLFKRNMIDIWNEHRARFPNSVHPPDSEICTNQVNKLKLMCGSCHLYRWILKLAANLLTFLFFAEFKRTTNYSAIFHSILKSPNLLFISQQHWKYKNLSIIDTNFNNHWFRWHDPCIKNTFIALLALEIHFYRTSWQPYGLRHLHALGIH